MIRKLKDIRIKSRPRKKMWTLHGESVQSDFSLYIKKYKDNSQKDGSVEGSWNVMNRALLEDKSCTCE